MSQLSILEVVVELVVIDILAFMVNMYSLGGVFFFGPLKNLGKPLGRLWGIFGTDWHWIWWLFYTWL